jgi:hypothetical protein
VPVWHAKTAELVKAGKLQSLGIVQEQHPDRAALYMQWQKMDWLVLADPFNLLGVKVVPITLLVDGTGIVRYRNPSEKDLEAFLAAHYPKVMIEEGDFSFDGSFEARKKEMEEKPKSAVAHFRYGVALRERFDSKDRKAGDFGSAIEAWRKALELKPDQYIWRRRIQQYGPRLDKPYSFYDWVNKAREDLKARGEVPHPLMAEPGGSEFAYPEKGGGAEKAAKHPDPEGKVSVDGEDMVLLSSVVVPTTKGDGGAVRVHLRFKPSPKGAVHWTNDAGNVSFYFENTEGFTVHDVQGPESPPKIAASAEERKIEFELRPVDGEMLPAKIEGAAYYYVCEGLEGVCRYLRKPLTIQLDG